MPSEANEQSKEERDISGFEVEKRTLFVSQREEASESLHYPESEKPRSEDRTPAAEKSAFGHEAVNVVTKEHVIEDL